MLSRDKLNHVANILNLKNDDAVGIDNVYDILTAIKEKDNNTFLKTILKLSNKDQDLTLLDNVFTAIKHEPNFEEDILDSFSDNQIKAKSLLVNNLEKLNLLNKDTEVVVWGCWYGSVLIPLLHDKVKKITAMDLDNNVVTIGQNRLFDNYHKVEWLTADLFKDYKEAYNSCDIFINTSCEHMLPMKWWGPKGPRKDWNWFKEWDGDYRKNQDENDWPVYDIGWWDRVKPNAHFAFTSNNMFDIPGHINCVNDIEEFKGQLPDTAEVLIEDEIKDERGIRYLLIGKI